MSFSWKDSKEIGYIAQTELLEQITKLKEDIIVPEICEMGEDLRVNAWFGPKGTVSPLHFDPKHNLFCQVVGSKYWRVFSSSESEKLYREEGRMNNTSRVDLENVDKEAFPLFEEAEWEECVLEEGDCLYLPPRYWHFVKSLSVSFSVSFWWTP